MTETPRPDSGPETGETLQMTTDPHGSIHRYEQPGFAPPGGRG